MKHYAGRSRKDPPLGGGGFPRTQGYCGEECNFVPCPDGYVYGHFETIQGDVDRKVRLERLGAAKADGFLDGVDIVWTAPREGNDPRTVVGWSRNARLFRERQHFGDDYPSNRHKNDGIDSYRVKAHIDDVVLLRPRDRTMDLNRGDAGWSGQKSWWFADETTNEEAREFVREVRELMATQSIPSVRRLKRNRKAGGLGKAGAAASTPYQRYVVGYEVMVHPRHDGLQKAFEHHLRSSHSDVSFQECHRDDLRYAIPGETPVMAEVKPTNRSTLRFAIRTAIGQLLDYRQDRAWDGRQLIVVETEVNDEGDLDLALGNGFGLAWPTENGFQMVWPSDRPKKLRG